MIKDPLTKKEHRELLKSFKEEFDKRYAELLKCIDPEDKLWVRHGEKGSFCLGKIALQVAAKGFRALTPELKVAEKHFIETI